MSVRDHLLFYARLKGVASFFERAVVQRMAENVQLDGDPFRKKASMLSGGMKRSARNSNVHMAQLQAPVDWHLADWEPEDLAAGRAHHWSAQA
jgi:hypothetical protein